MIAFRAAILGLLLGSSFFALNQAIPYVSSLLTVSFPDFVKLNVFYYIEEVVRYTIFALLILTSTYFYFKKSDSGVSEGFFLGIIFTMALTLILILQQGVNFYLTDLLTPEYLIPVVEIIIVTTVVGSNYRELYGNPNWMQAS